MKFRKKPVEVEARQLIDDPRNHEEIAEWIRSHGVKAGVPMISPCLHIETLEGDMRADVGDYIIQGVQGGFYPCKPDIFEATYEAVDE